MSELAEVGEFGPNETCPDAGKTDKGNIVKYGTTPKGLQRYRCKTCGKTFSENTGTMFYNKHTPTEEIIETLALIAEGSRVASLSRVKGYKEETIRNWLQQAAAHATQIENVLMREYEIERGQIDALWSYVGCKEVEDTKQDTKQDTKEGKKDAPDDERGVYWRSTMIDIDTRLRVGRGIAQTETEASEEVFQTLQTNRGHLEKPPPTISDGWGGIREAMVEVWGKVPEYNGHGRPPEKKRPEEDWEYLQVIKERNEKGRVTGTKKKAVFGEEGSLLDIILLDIFAAHTAYVERTHLTMRQMNSRLVRKGLGFSKKLPMHRAAATWEDATYNLTRTHQSLRIDQTGPLNGRPGRRWKRRTPAMAAGLTDQVWSIEKLLRTVPTTNT